MKKILFTSILLFSTIITNAQTPDGEWKIEKVRFLGTAIYFDDSGKDKKNFLNCSIKLYGAENDPEVKNDIIKKLEENYANAKKLYKASIEFKDEMAYFNELDDADELKPVEATLRVGNDILQFFGNRLYGSYKYKMELKKDKLVLTEFRDHDGSSKDLSVYFYSKK